MIEVKNLNHFYGKDKALSNVNFTIDSEKFIAITGESGSGKSTLLSCISTLLRPTSAEIRLLNTNINEIPNIDQFRRNNIGFIFQFHYLINYLTVFENIALASNDHEYILDLLENLNILDIKDKYPNQISGGQRQRAAIARALANKPKVIFADEPTGNLDSKNSMNVLLLLNDIAKKGTTIIVATHNDSIRKNADIVYEVVDGTVSKYN